MRRKKSEQQLALPIVEQVRTRSGTVLYFGDDYRRLLRMRRAKRSPAASLVKE